MESLLISNLSRFFYDATTAQKKLRIHMESETIMEVTARPVQEVMELTDAVDYVAMWREAAKGGRQSPAHIRAKVQLHVLLYHSGETEPQFELSLQPWTRCDSVATSLLMVAEAGRTPSSRLDLVIAAGYRKLLLYPTSLHRQGDQYYTITFHPMARLKHAVLANLEHLETRLWGGVMR